MFPQFSTGYGPRDAEREPVVLQECPAANPEEIAAIKIPKFTGTNFSTWCVLALNILDIKFPGGSIDECPAALILLKLSLNEQALRLVINTASVAELMVKLQQYYAPKNSSRHRLLMSELRMLKAGSVKDVANYIDEFNRIVCEMKAIANVDEDEMATTFLQGLPHQMENFVSMLTTMVDLGTVKLDLNSLYSKVKEESLRLALSKGYKPSITEGAEPIALGAKLNKSNNQYLRPPGQSVASGSSWIIDSGATHHFTHDEMIMSDCRPINSNVTVGNGVKVQAVGIGEVKLGELVLKPVYLVPELHRNLLSVSAIMKEGYKLTFAVNSCMIEGKSHSKKVVLTMKDDQFTLPVYNKLEALSATSRNADVDWHKRLGHAGTSTVQKLARPGVVKGGPKKEESQLSKSTCETCKIANIKREPFPSRNRNSEILELIHVDLCGPIEPDRIGNTYFITFTDDASKKAYVRPLLDKTRATQAMIDIQSLWERQTGKLIKRVRTDNGREFLGEFDEYLRKQGIVHETTAPESPEQNGVAERLNQTLLTKVRTILEESKLPKSFWCDALSYACYTRDRTPSESLNNKTPYELWTGEPPYIGHLRPFGCKVIYKFVAFKQAGKIHPKGGKGIFLGYTLSSSNYKILTDEGKIVVCKHVQFFENEFPGFHQDFMTKRALVTELNVDPRSYKEAVNSKQKEEWKSAMNDEYMSLIRNETWTLTDLPPGHKAIQAKWCFRTKFNEKGEEERKKARLVAKGFQQIAGIDFEDTFAPTTSLKSLRILLSIAASKDYEIHQLDIKTAFLNAVLHEEIYMIQPEGFVDKTHPSKVCKLNKALYGLKQSPRAWCKTLSKKLNEIGYKPLISDPSIFKNGGKYIAAYVDDLLIISPSISEVERVKKCLLDAFELHDKGEAKFFLGMELIRCRKDRTIQLSQSQYASEILKRFSMEDSKSQDTPMEEGLKLSRNNSGEFCNYPYREAVGSLMYLMMGTRPDLCFSVSYLSRFLDCFDKSHCTALKRILRYVKKTQSYRLTLGGNELKLMCYTDSDWANSEEDRRSISGYIVMLGDYCVSWSTKRQSTVALSTSEAEYYSLTECAKETVWTIQLLNQLGICCKTPKIYEDNLGALKWARDPVEHKRTKHIDIKYHFIRDLIENQVIELDYIETSKMLADITTKPIGRLKFTSQVHSLGLRGECYVLKPATVS